MIGFIVGMAVGASERVVVGSLVDMIISPVFSGLGRVLSDDVHPGSSISTADRRRI